MTVADTSFLIDILRRAPGAVRLVEEFGRRGEPVWIPAPALHELAYGAGRSHHAKSEFERLEELTRRLPVLAFETAAARLAGTLEADMERTGRRPGVTDIQIAALALMRGESVVTRDGSFPRPPGLRVETYEPR